MEWSKQEKEIARKAFNVAYRRECKVIAINTRKMVDEINEPSDLWKVHNYLTEKRKETDQKYEYRYSILLLIFARLICEGWISEEDLMGFSDDKLKVIQRNTEFIHAWESKNI